MAKSLTGQKFGRLIGFLALRFAKISGSLELFIAKVAFAILRKSRLDTKRLPSGYQMTTI